MQNILLTFGKNYFDIMIKEKHTHKNSHTHQSITFSSDFSKMRLSISIKRSISLSVRSFLLIAYFPSSFLYDLTLDSLSMNPFIHPSIVFLFTPLYILISCKSKEAASIGLGLVFLILSFKKMTFLTFFQLREKRTQEMCIFTRSGILVDKSAQETCFLPF